MPIAIRTAPVALALAAAAAIVPAVAAAAPATVEFTAAGTYTVVVPAGVEEIQAEVIGGEGGAGAGPDNPFPLPTPGGKGAMATGTVPVTPGETLTVNVGGAGADVGGFGGGGVGGSGYDAGTGGAASSLERGDAALLVAGGGGGGGGWGGAGGAGDMAGGDVQGATQARGGEPGTATGAGDGGLGGNFPTACTTRQGGTDGQPGSGVEGGIGGAAPATAGGGGGGGGGGWFGGGGGGGGSFCETVGQFAGGGGGGGGSSHLGASVTGGAIGTSDRTGDGLVFIAFVDAVAPAASPVATSEPVADGWSDAPVTVQWNWSDIGGAGFDFCTQETTSTGDGEQTLGATCIDREGNIGTADFAVKVDTTPPVITPAVPAQGATFTVGAAATVAFACTDAGSGVAGCSGSPAQGAALDTSAPGEHVVTLSATDAVGNATTLDVAYTVVKPQPPPSGQEPPPPPPVPEPPTATLRAPARLIFGRPVRIGCGPEADACRVQLRRRGKLLAKGTGVAGTRARIRLTATGRRVLRRHRGGVRVTVRAVATLDGVEQTLTAKRRAVLRRR